MNKKRLLLKLIALLLFNATVILIANKEKWKEKHFNCLSGQKELEHQRDERLSSKIKTILFWNGPKRSELTVFGTGNDAFVQHGCPASDCEIVNSPYQYSNRPLDSYDAILFNFNDEFWLTKRPQFQRRPHQRFIFFTQEPPPSIEPMNIADYDGYFNWTMTYRMDSDIPLLYGRIQPKPSAPTTAEEIRIKISNATRQRLSKRTERKGTCYVAAMISHCETHGGREEYITQLEKYIEVDIYGPCTDQMDTILHCDRNELLSSTPECYDMLESKYKFYLSFENSICPDYVTEKFFQIMAHDMVPVVYGGANYSRIAPAHSYINALNYKPKELAAYLKTLASNEALYNEYFWWKDDYVVEAGLAQMVRNGFCELCRKLNDRDQQGKIYASLSPQWNAIQCQRPKHRQMEKPFPLINISAINMLNYYFHRS